MWREQQVWTTPPQQYVSWDIETPQTPRIDQVLTTYGDLTRATNPWWQSARVEGTAGGLTDEVMQRAAANMRDDTAADLANHAYYYANFFYVDQYGNRISAEDWHQIDELTAATKYFKSIPELEGF